MDDVGNRPTGMVISRLKERFNCIGPSNHTAYEFVTRHLVSIIVD